MAVEQSSQTTLTLASAIDNFNVTTFFNKTHSTEKSSQQIIKELKRVKTDQSFKMIHEDDINIQNNNNNNNNNDNSSTTGNDSSMMMQRIDDNNSNNSQSMAAAPIDAQNNNHLNSSEMNLVQNDLLNNAVDGVENMLISECGDVNMEAEQQLTSKEKDLIKIIQIKDVKIKELEILLNHKDEEIANLKSHLDKFQSVFSSAMNRKIGTTRNIQQRQRAQGISAEPQSQSSMNELLNVAFPKYEKNER